MTKSILTVPLSAIFAKSFASYKEEACWASKASSDEWAPEASGQRHWAGWYYAKLAYGNNTWQRW